MRPTDDPSFLTPDERLSEVASILAAGPVPEELRPVYHRLHEALARHMQITRAADAGQNAKRALHRR